VKGVAAAHPPEQGTAVDAERPAASTGAPIPGTDHLPRARTALPLGPCLLLVGLGGAERDQQAATQIEGEVLDVERDELGASERRGVDASAAHAATPRDNTAYTCVAASAGAAISVTAR
jgi:hypothetical protein